MLVWNCVSPPDWATKGSSHRVWGRDSAIKTLDAKPDNPSSISGTCVIEGASRFCVLFCDPNTQSVACTHAYTYSHKAFRRI